MAPVDVMRRYLMLASDERVALVVRERFADPPPGG
jgi:hypothetical protein